MNRSTARLLSAVVLCLSTSAFAQFAGETVSLGLISSSQCGQNGYELRRTDRGPEGAYTPVNAPYVVPNGFRLEVTDVVYEIANVKAVGLDAYLILWTRDRSSGATLDGITHKHAFEQHYAADSAGTYRPQYAVNARFGTHHVQFDSGIQTSLRTRLCVTVHSDRYTSIFFRGRLHTGPSYNTAPIGGGVIGGGGVIAYP